MGLRSLGTFLIPYLILSFNIVIISDVCIDSFDETEAGTVKWDSTNWLNFDLRYLDKKVKKETS